MLDQCIKTEIDLEGLNVHLDKLLISINDVEFSDQLGEGIHNQLQMQCYNYNVTFRAKTSIVCTSDIGPAMVYKIFYERCISFKFTELLI